MTRLGCCVTAVVIVLAGCAGDRGYEPVVPGGDARRGRAALAEFECDVCHSIPGIRSPRTYVGPPLDSMSREVYLAGKFPNTPDILIRWIVDAPALAPHTAMPDVGVPEHAARDMAAYLYSIDPGL